MEDVARSRAQIYSPFRPQFTQGDGDGSVHWSTDNVSLRESSAESQLGPEGYGARPTKSPSPSLYNGSSLPVANSKSDDRHVSANSLLSGSRSRSPSTVTTPSHRSVMSQDGHSVRDFGRLGLRERGWGQNDPAVPFANAKFDGRLVPLNPLLSRGRSPSCQTVASGEGRSVGRTASLAPSKNAVD